MDTSKFWFDNFTPDALVSTQNPKEVEKILHILNFKVFLMENELGIKMHPLYYDSFVSSILGADVYYVGMGRKKAIINKINKICKLNISPHTLNVRLQYANMDVILIESRQWYGDNIEAHCLQAQLYYNFRRNYLNGTNYRRPKQFIEKFYYPIADDLTDFLVQNGVNCHEHKHTKHMIDLS